MDTIGNSSSWLWSEALVTLVPSRDGGHESHRRHDARVPCFQVRLGVAPISAGNTGEGGRRMEMKDVKGSSDETWLLPIMSHSLRAIQS